MRTSLAAVMLGLGIGLAPAYAVELDPNPGTTEADQILQILSEGVNEYYTGRYDQAAARFADALALNPENKLIYEFYLALGHEKVLRMLERAELTGVMEDILRRHNIYQEELRDSDDYIRLLISKLDEDGDEKKRFVATRELVAIGPIAIPHLLEKLVDNREDRLRVYSRVTLTQMGYRAVVPLCEALKSEDPRMVTSVAVALADIKDPRALPKLHQLVDQSEDETVVRVCRNAIAAIAAANQMAVVPEAPVLYFDQALRYFEDGDQVRDEVVANESLMWRWTGSETGLVYETVPRYAWNELMAEQLLFDGATAYTEYEGFYPLLAADFAAQLDEASMRLKLAQARITEPKHPDETLPALEARVSALAELPDRIDAFGPVHLYRAVQKAVVSERYATAVRLMAHLRDTFTSDPEFYLPSRDEGLLAGKPGTVLVAALDHADRRIAYHAAITLAHLDPKLEFFNAERVIPLLSQAVGEWGMKVVLVVEPDYRERNAARKALQDQGLLVFTAADGFEARMRLAESPVKDAIIVAGDLVPSLRDDNGQLIDVPEQTAAGLIQALRGEPSTAETPIFLSLPQNDELAVQVQNALGDQVDAVIGKPFNGVEMAGAVETAIGDDELPEINRQAREDIAQAAAEALESIDPVKSQFALAGALDSLLATISQRADPIRIPALRAIGHIGAADRVAAVTDVYQELDRSGDLTNDDVRIAFLDCIGMLDPNTPAAIEIIAAAMQSENREVRRAAHLAAGHGRAIAPQTLLLYQTQQRLDVRASGAAGE